MTPPPPDGPPSAGLAWPDRDAGSTPPVHEPETKT